MSVTSGALRVNYALIIAFLVVGSVSCSKKGGNLMQEQDTTGGHSEAATAAEHDQKDQQQAVDPEYIKRELKDVIARQVDIDSDGQVSYEELKKYLAILHERNIKHNVDKQWTIYSPQVHEVFSWEGYEPDKKEVLTWDHYYNQTYPELVGVDVGIPIYREQDTASLLNPPEAEEGDTGAKKRDSQNKKEKEDKPMEPEALDEGDDEHMRMLKLMVRRADARWKLADENGDTLLTKDEFKNLLHPDEGHEGLRDLFVKEATEDMDLNKDGKICLDEFMKHLQVLANDQERNDQHWLSSQQENFGRFLDKNKDGVLDGDEIKNWLIPSKSVKFETEAKRLLDIGDQNEDHKISNAELIEHYEQYVSLLPAEYWASPSDADESSDLSSLQMGDHGMRDEL